MTEIYPKFYAPYERNYQTKFVKESNPKEYLYPYMNNETRWVYSEKLDGTNTRIIWDGYKVNVLGRTEKSELIPYQKQLAKKLSENGNAVLDDLFGTKSVTIFGETIGPKINGNNHKLEECSFIVFDVLIDGIWLKYDSICEISHQLNLKTVTKRTVIGWNRFIKIFNETSKVRNEKEIYFEGFVAYPEHMPLTRTGERVITKIKVRDFEGGTINE